MHLEVQTAKLVSHFSFKGALAPIALLEVISDDLSGIDAQLKMSMQKTPLLLKNAPTVIDLSRLPELSNIDMGDLIQILRARGLSPVGFRSSHPKWGGLAKSCGLVEFPIRKPVSKVSDQSHSSVPRLQCSQRLPKVITSHVRSGQRIVAPDGDLIIMSSVSAGAEVLAAGNIHVYGTLRGRALAGIQGNDQCQIFCHHLESELLAIAGQYKLCDDIEQECWQTQAHIYLSEGKLVIQSLT